MNDVPRYLVLAMLLSFCVGQVRLWRRTGWCATLFFSVAMLMMYPQLAWGTGGSNAWVVPFMAGCLLALLGLIFTVTFEQNAHEILKVVSLGRLLTGSIPEGKVVPRPDRWRFDGRKALGFAGSYAVVALVFTVLMRSWQPMLLFGSASIGIVLIIALRWLLGR